MFEKDVVLILQQRGELEDEPVDVEGDDEQYEEYTWAGQTRIRATTMLEGGFARKYFNHWEGNFILFFQKHF